MVNDMCVTLCVPDVLLTLDPMRQHFSEHLNKTSAVIIIILGNYRGLDGVDLYLPYVTSV